MSIIKVADLGISSGVNKPAFSATLSSNQSLTTNTSTKVIFNTEVFDTDSAYDTSTGRFTCPKDGKYLFTSTVSMSSNFTYVQLDFYKNGSKFYRGAAVRNDTSATTVTALIDLSASDYIEVFCRQSSTNDAEGNVTHTHFHGHRIIGA
tara:strand:- start:40 stop:486 length:447 start_codon:yes stop_codon:yes gene_type:complete